MGLFLAGLTRFKIVNHPPNAFPLASLHQVSNHDERLYSDVQLIELPSEATRGQLNDLLVRVRLDGR